MPIIDEVRHERTSSNAAIALDDLGVERLHLDGVQSPTIALEPWPPTVRARPETDFALVVQAALKRALDMTVAGLVLLLSLPLVAVVSLAIVIESRGPVFYRAERVGLGGRTLRMLKFRKMHQNAS